MPRGGKRAGAGRKPGAANKRTRAIADKAAEQGKTPLEIMQSLTFEQHESYLALKAMPFSAETAKACGAAALATIEGAKACAPYMHPRLKPGDPPVKLPGLEKGTFNDRGMVVMAAIASGMLAPETGATLMQALGTHARIKEVDELAERVKALEEQYGTGRKSRRV